MTIGRVAERLFIVLAATASIWMGWNLFKTGILKKQEAEIKAGGAIIKFRDVGPGTFFTFFGAAVLVAALSQNLLIQKNSGPSSGAPASGGETVVYLTSGRAQNDKDLLKALNTLIAIDAGGTWNSNPKNLKPAMEVLNSVRAELLRKKFPRYFEYVEARRRAHSDPANSQALRSFDQSLIDSITKAEQETYL